MWTCTITRQLATVTCTRCQYCINIAMRLLVHSDVHKCLCCVVTTCSSTSSRHKTVGLLPDVLTRELSPGLHLFWLFYLLSVLFFTGAIVIVLVISLYCKTRIVRVPFISWISWPWQPRENNGSLIYILAAIS